MGDMSNVRNLLPGLLLCVMVSVGALALEQLEILITGDAWLEALVLAILGGAVVRTLWTPTPRLAAGINFGATSVLELAIVLMGATTSLGAIAGAGFPLLIAIATTVVVAIVISFGIGRLVGLPEKMALLVACGNSICGNSAIAAVAPAIDADSDDVATSIAFTAVLGVGVVLTVPLVAHYAHLSAVAGGILAGLTVYAVPQVIAAAGPMGTVAVQVGTLVKLVRVLMLGPVVATASVLHARHGGGPRDEEARLSPTRLVPPFIIGFLVLALVNSFGFVPAAASAPAHQASNLLTILAMAALGLGVDFRSVAKAGPRVIVVVTASLLILAAIAFVVLSLLNLR